MSRGRLSQLFNMNRFYDLLAPVYATGMQLLPVWRRYTEAVLPALPAGDVRVLEIGPGPGLLLCELAARYPFVVGLDLSSGMLRQAHGRLAQAGWPVRLSRADAGQLAFAGATFDAVVMTFTLSAIPDGLGVMREVVRVLRPGGRLVLVDAGYPADENLFGRAICKLWETFGDFMRDEATLMTAAGLVVVMRREFGAFDSIRLVVGERS